MYQIAGRFISMNAFTNNLERTYVSEFTDPLETYSDDKFLGEFRMTKEEVKMLCGLLSEDLNSRGSRKCDLNVEQKVLISLKLLASGSFQNCAKDFLSVSQPVFSRTLDPFLDALNKKVNEFIYTPRTVAETDEVKKKFYAIARVPGDFGDIDGCHTPIIAPSIDEFAFVNRKKFYLINIQTVM